MQNALAAISLITQIERRLAGDGNMFTYAILLAIKEQKPATLVLRTIAEQAADNPPALAAIFGEELLGEIVRFNNAKTRTNGK